MGFCLESADGVWGADDDTDTGYLVIGFMPGRDGVDAASSHRRIHGDSRSFPDRTPGEAGEDTFPGPAARGVHLLDRVVIEEPGGELDAAGDRRILPLPVARPR